ncbi:response regulator [Spirosoma arcticum]
MKNQEVHIIDDSADYRLLVQHVFNHFLSQYKTRFFASGNALQEHIQFLLNQAFPDEHGSDAPDLAGPGLILLDLNMTGLSGYQTLLYLKQSPWRNTPVVVMTSLGSDEEIEQCYKAGVSLVISKPIGIEPMKHRMSEVCHHWLELNQLPVGESAEQLNFLR